MRGICFCERKGQLVMENKNRRQLVSGSVWEEHGSHQFIQTSRKLTD